MKMRIFFFIVLIYNARVIRSDLRFVNYKLVSSASSSSGRRACAEAYADNEYLAARINDVTGICEGLTWDWGSCPQFETGYSYLRKLKTTEIYQPPVQISTTFPWLIPGIFGAGGSLEFHISMPTGSSWTGFEINIMNITESSFNLYDSEPEIIMVHIYVSRQAGQLFLKTWVNRWANKLNIQNPFADESVYKITVVPHTDFMQILFDGEEVVQFTHPTDPATAKQILFTPYSDTVLELHNITFIGI